jgi:hypothetical protein
MKASHDRVFKSAGHFSIVILTSALAELATAAIRLNQKALNMNLMQRGVLTTHLHDVL